MAITDPPAEGRWYEAEIIGTVDTSDLLPLDPATTGQQAQTASRLAVAELLPSELDIYISARTRRGEGSVRITGIPFGTYGLGLPGLGETEARVIVWVGETGNLVHALDPDGVELPVVLSSAIAAQAARRALGTQSHRLGLGEFGSVTWTPRAVRIGQRPGIPQYGPPWLEFGYSDTRLGNYVPSTDDPGYEAWLWFTNPRTGAPEDTAHALTPEQPQEPVLIAPGLPDLSPVRPPLLEVQSLERLRGGWVEPEPPAESEEPGAAE